MTSIRINFFSNSGRGFGHASRAKALGDFLEKKTAEKICYGRLGTSSTQDPRLANVDFCRHEIHDIEIIDSPNSEDELLKWFSAKGSKTVSFDHRGRFRSDLTITADPSAKFSRGLKHLIGMKYAVIRDELRFRDLDLRGREDYSLVVIGGEDASGLSLRVANQVSRRFGEIKVAVGPWNKNRTIRLRGTSLHSNQNSFPKILKGARFAFSSGGTILLELLHNGIPTYVIPQNQPELLMARHLSLRGLILGIGVPEKPPSKNRELMSGTKSREVVDGMGLQRISEELKTLVQEH